MYRNNLMQILDRTHMSLKDLSIDSHVNLRALKYDLHLPINMWNHDDLNSVKTVLNLRSSNDKLVSHRLAPCLQYAGGKGRLIPEIIRYMPKRSLIKHYYEPFVGGGSVFLFLAMNNCTINDYNKGLTNVYRQLKYHYLTPAPVYFKYPSYVHVKNGKANMHNLLKYFQTKNTKKGYYTIRNLDRTPEIKNATPLERACRFIFLNKAGFNGMMRYNRKHQENIPWGRTKHITLDPSFLVNDAHYLKNANVKINSGDYWDSIKNAQAGDFIYCDPPYIKRNPQSFVGYTSKGFGFESNKLLAKHAVQLVKRGVYLELSNADLPVLHKLYPKKYFTIHKVRIHRLIGASDSSRKNVNEAIISSNNY